MFSTRVSAAQIIGRLNAEANAPEFVRNAELIRDCSIPSSSLSEHVSAPINNSIRSISEELLSQGGTIPMFRPADIDGWWLSDESAPRINASFEERHAKSRVTGGDLVLAIAGTIGAAARVPTAVSRGAVNGSCARIKPKAGCDGYLLAYLNSEIGGRAMGRLAVGSVQKHLNLEDLPDLPVIHPVPEVRAYIGDKVREAHELYSEAKEIESLVGRAVERLLEGTVTEAELASAQAALDLGDHLCDDNVVRSLRSLSSKLRDSSNAIQRWSRVSPCESSPDRLDAGYYQPRFLENAEFLDGCSVPLREIASISERCNCGATPKQVEYGHHGQGLIRTADIRPNIFLAADVLRTTSLSVPASAAAAAIAGDLVYTMSGTVGYAAVIPDTEEVYSFSNTVVRARIAKNAGCDPRFIAAFFNCRYGYTQSLRLVSGGIQGHVMPNPFKRLLVPTPAYEAQRYIGNKARRAEECRRRSAALTEAAKRLVEALIQDEVSESELSEAHQALAQSDSGPDRSILARLGVVRGDSGEVADAGV